MNIIKNGSKKSSPSNKPAPPAIELEEAKTLLQMIVCGANETTIAEFMAEWQEAKKSEGWKLVAAYFQNCADFNPEIETGKAIARLNLLFQNSMKIQDFKSCLSIQKEINKLLSLYAE